MILKTDNLCTNYNGAPMLRNISFSMEEGEILSLLGRSGSGKTTLLRTVAGLETPCSGTIFFQNQEITHTPPHKREFGMMFQDYALFPHKNVGENIAFGLEMQKLSRANQQQRVDEVLELVGLSNYTARKIKDLSGGEQQRVALARSLAPRPRLLLLDEPLGSLDRSLRDRLAIEIRTILKQLKMTAVLVTHDQTEAFSMADNIVILLKGEISQLAQPKEIYQHPANREIAEFLGFKNFVTGTTATSLFTSILGETPPQSTTPGLTLLLRPEGARLATKPDKALLSGIVVDKAYLGPRYLITLQTMGDVLSFELPLQPAPPDVGEEIALLLDKEALVQLP